MKTIKSDIMANNAPFCQTNLSQTAKYIMINRKVWLHYILSLKEDFRIYAGSFNKFCLLLLYRLSIFPTEGFVTLT